MFHRKSTINIVSLHINSIVDLRVFGLTGEKEERSAQKGQGVK